MYQTSIISPKWNSDHWKKLQQRTQILRRPPQKQKILPQEPSKPQRKPRPPTFGKIKTRSLSSRIGKSLSQKCLSDPILMYVEVTKSQDDKSPGHKPEYSRIADARKAILRTHLYAWDDTPSYLPSLSTTQSDPSPAQDALFQTPLDPQAVLAYVSTLLPSCQDPEPPQCQEPLGQSRSSSTPPSPPASSEPVSEHDTHTPTPPTTKTPCNPQPHSPTPPSPTASPQPAPSSPADPRTDPNTERIAGVPIPRPLAEALRLFASRMQPATAQGMAQPTRTRTRSHSTHMDPVSPAPRPTGMAKAYGLLTVPTVPHPKVQPPPPTPPSPAPDLTKTDFLLLLSAYRALCASAGVEAHTATDAPHVPQATLTHTGDPNTQPHQATQTKVLNVQTSHTTAKSQHTDSNCPTAPPLVVVESFCASLGIPFNPPHSFTATLSPSAWVAARTPVPLPIFLQAVYPHLSERLIHRAIAVWGGDSSHAPHLESVSWWGDAFPSDTAAIQVRAVWRVLVGTALRLVYPSALSPPPSAEGGTLLPSVVPSRHPVHAPPPAHVSFSATVARAAAAVRDALAARGAIAHVPELDFVELPFPHLAAVLPRIHPRHIWDVFAEAAVPPTTRTHSPDPSPPRPTSEPLPPLDPPCPAPPHAPANAPTTGDSNVPNPRYPLEWPDPLGGLHLPSVSSLAAASERTILSVALRSAARDVALPELPLGYGWFEWIPTALLVPDFDSVASLPDYTSRAANGNLVLTLPRFAEIATVLFSSTT